MKIMSVSNGHTADYICLAAALKAQWPIFLKLELDFNSFKPKNFSEFNSNRVQYIEYLTENFSGMTGSELEGFDNERLRDFLANDEHQFFLKFREPITAHLVNVIILAHAFCESIINTYMRISLVELGKEEYFLMVDKCDFKDKWLVAPKLVSSEYCLLKDSGVYETLNQISNQRNALVHTKVQVFTDKGDAFEKCSSFKRRTFKQELCWIRRYYSLPFDLLDNLLRHFKPCPFLEHVFSAAPIERCRLHSKC